MRQTVQQLDRRKQQNARIMSSKFRAVFLKHPTGQSVLWHILVYHCGIFQNIQNEDGTTRHNMGIELMEMCRLVDEDGTPAQLFEQIQRLKPKKRNFIKRIFRRKSCQRQQK